MPRKVNTSVSIEELERQLAVCEAEEKRVKLEARRVKDAIEGERRGQEAKRAGILGAMLLCDRSDAARVIMAAYMERLEVPGDRALFGLPARERGLIGAPASGAMLKDATPDPATPADADGRPTDPPGARGEGDEASPDPVDPEGGLAAAAGGGGSGGAAAGSAPMSDRPGGVPGRMREGRSDAPSTPSDGALATRSAPTGGAVAPIDGSAEGTSATGLRSRPEVADGTPTSSDPDVVDPSESPPPPFAPRAFISSWEASKSIKALGLRLQKRDGGTWTVTANTPAELASLAPLGLTPYDGGQA